MNLSSDSPLVCCVLLYALPEVRWESKFPGTCPISPRVYPESYFFDTSRYTHILTIQVFGQWYGMVLGFFADRLLPSPASCYIECQQPATRRNPVFNTLSYEVNPGVASTFLCDATGIINKGPKPGWCPAPNTPRRRLAVECRTAGPRTKTCRFPDRSTTRRLHVDALDDVVVTCHKCLTRKLAPTAARETIAPVPPPLVLPGGTRADGRTMAGSVRATFEQPGNRHLDRRPRRARRRSRFYW